MIDTAKTSFNELPEPSNADYSYWLEKEGWKWLWFYGFCVLVTLLSSHFGVLPDQTLAFWTFGMTFLYLPARLTYLLIRARRIHNKE